MVPDMHYPALLKSSGWGPTSFPGSLILPPPGASEERPWHTLVTCLPESGRWQKIVKGMGGLVGILSILNLRGTGCVVTKINQERDDALILQMPRKTHLSSDCVGCCRLCGLVKEVTYCKKYPQEGEWRIGRCGDLAVNGRSLTHLYPGRKPYLLCRCCERR